MYNKPSKYSLSILVFALAIIGLFANFKTDNRDRSNGSQTVLFLKDTANQLMTISNIDNFYFTDFGYTIQNLSEFNNVSQTRIRSISIYRYSSTYQKFLFEDSLLLDNHGIPVLNMKSDDSKRVSHTWFFYDNCGNRYLDVNIGSNNYDTIYTLRKFDRFNHPCQEINYNITRKEFGRLTMINLLPVTDSVIKLNLVIYESDIKHEHVLPFESRDMVITQMPNSTVQVKTTRIVHTDNAYNSAYTDVYRLDNNKLIPSKSNASLSYDSNGNWTEKKDNGYTLKRIFNGYQPYDAEPKNVFSINHNLLNFLYSQLDSIPLWAWKAYKKNQNSLGDRLNLMKSDLYGKGIDLLEAKTIKDFTPRLWNLVCTDSGLLTGIQNRCLVAGYNTPLKDKDGNNIRCLAIYEWYMGKYWLKKQSFGAIESFVDQNDDLLFDQYDEINFSVAIENGSIDINYNYMRGEASYTFSFENGNWILENYTSNHRTCCKAESYAYNYKTKTKTVSVSSTTDDNEGNTPGDTTIITIQQRPVMYMDSLNVKSLDYSETGLLVK